MLASGAPSGSGSDSLLCVEPREREERADGSADVHCEGEAKPEAEGARPPLPLRGSARLLFGARLDLNCAPPASFESLPGVGPSRAASLVAGRPFGGLAELQRVPGIGPVTLRRLAPYLEVSQTSVSGRACRERVVTRGVIRP